MRFVKKMIVEPRIVIKEQKRRFPSWLKEHGHLFQGNSIDDTTLTRLAAGPSSNVTSWQAYEINGYTYYTKAKDNKSVAYQNSGVRIDAIDKSGSNITYYGFIEEIWELDYGENIRFPVFRCQWVKHPNGVTKGNKSVAYQNSGVRIDATDKSGNNIITMGL
jgi:hypothetical protein